MKRFLFLLVAMTALLTVAQPYYVNLDTIEGRCERYYYHDWFDECGHYATVRSEWYHEPLVLYYPSTDTMVEEGCNEVAQGRMAVKGIVAMVAINPMMHPLNYARHRRNEEYVMLYEDVKGQALAVARWDTATPYLMRLPLGGYYDSIGGDVLELHAYEAYFEEPVVVEDEFFMMATLNSNRREGGDSTLYSYYRTEYVALQLLWDVCLDEECPSDHKWVTRVMDKYDSSRLYWNVLSEEDHFLMPCGPLLAIVDYYSLEVQPDDSVKGSTTGGGRFPARSIHPVQAIPAPGYRFESWSDGVVDNPRMVELARDTLLTAHFVEEGSGGTEGVASAEEGLDGIALCPNPARRSITVEAAAADDYRVELYDATGRCLRHSAFHGRSVTLDVALLPAGTYLVKVVSAAGACTLSFVKQ